MALRSSVKMFNLINGKRSTNLKYSEISFLSYQTWNSQKTRQHTLKVRLLGNRHIYTLLIVMWYDKTLLVENLEDVTKLKIYSLFDLGASHVKIYPEIHPHQYNIYLHKALCHIIIYNCKILQTLKCPHVG